VIARAIALAVFVTFITSWADPAGAQPDPGNREKAASHFRQGQAYFQAQDYDRALAEYQAAFDLSSEPLLIFNIALCHDRANRPEQALKDFRRYLARVSTGAIADEAREDVARLVPIVDKIVADRKTDESRRRDEAGRHDAAQARANHVRLYVVVAGAVVAAAGATSHVLAWRTSDRMVHAPDPDAYFAARDTFKLERGVAIGAYAAGAVTIATGLILGRVLRPRDGVEVSAAISPSGAALTVGWSR